jgi:BlaI family transcriptional regulator, penicillinase repressor
VARRSTAHPTPAELGILTVLWRRGQSTVREVHEELGSDVGYTTVLKLLQIMTAKGLVKRREPGRTHVYEAAMTEESNQRRMVSDLVDRAFGGSALRLVVQALSTTPATPEELQEIRRLLDDMNGADR